MDCASPWKNISVGPTAGRGLAIRGHRHDSFDFLVENALDAGDAPVGHQLGIRLVHGAKRDAQRDNNANRKQAQQQDRDEQLHQRDAGPAGLRRVLRQAALGARHWAGVALTYPRVHIGPRESYGR